MKIFVSGAAGFVGRPLCAALVRAGHFVVAATRSRVPNAIGSQDVVVDILDTCNLARYLEDVEVVVHLAAAVHSVGYPVTSLDEYRRVNVGGTINLAHASASNGVKRFVHVSTIGVHGRGDTTGAAILNERSPFAPYDPYTISKYEAELALKDTVSRSGMPVVILRPAVIYGPRAPGNLARLLHLVYRGVPIPHGLQLRSLMGLDNFIDLLSLCCNEKSADGQVFTVSDGEDVTTAWIVSILARSLDRVPRTVYIPKHVVTGLHAAFPMWRDLHRLFLAVRVDPAKAMATLSWAPRITIERGLIDMAQEHLRSLQTWSSAPPEGH